MENQPADLSNGTQTSVRLLRRARGGDARALDALLGRNVPPLLAWARGRLPRWARDLADTADVVQESVVNALRNLEHFTPRHQGALQAYLRRAVMNRIRDEVRRVGRRPVVSMPEDAVAIDPEASPLDALLGAEAARRYATALARLKPREQQAIVARLELGYSYEQVALTIDSPSADAARMVVTRGLARLAQEMEE